MELSHEKPGLLNSYSPYLSVPRFSEADQTELDRQFPADWDTSDCRPLASMFTNWCGEDESMVWVLSLVSTNAAEGLKKPREPLGHPGEP